MKLDYAIHIGDVCGLSTPEEAVNNILIHYQQFMTEDEHEREMTELMTEAELLGIKFHDVPGCGLAMINGRCYICDKMEDIINGESM